MRVGMSEAGMREFWVIRDRRKGKQTWEESDHRVRKVKCGYIRVKDGKRER